MSDEVLNSQQEDISADAWQEQWIEGQEDLLLSNPTEPWDYGLFISVVRCLQHRDEKLGE